MRCFGAKIGKQVHIYPSAKISIPWNITIDDFSAIGDGAILYALGPISIGASVTISQRAHICAGSHNFSSPEMELTKPPISIEPEAWICAEAFVGPGVTIARGSVVGARAVVTKDTAEHAIVAGNPARPIGRRKIKQH